MNARATSKADCAYELVLQVYTLENFPSLRTLVKDKRSEFEATHGPNSKTVSILTGDFNLGLFRIVHLVTVGRQGSPPLLTFCPGFCGAEYGFALY